MRCLMTWPRVVILSISRVRMAWSRTSDDAPYDIIWPTSASMPNSSARIILIEGRIREKTGQRVAPAGSSWFWRLGGGQDALGFQDPEGGRGAEIVDEAPGLWCPDPGAMHAAEFEPQRVTSGLDILGRRLHAVEREIDDFGFRVGEGGTVQKSERAGETVEPFDQSRVEVNDLHSLPKCHGFERGQHAVDGLAGGARGLAADGANGSGLAAERAETA